ncbi:putative ATP-dependent NAD(P)H-hydrate dehydratase [Blattamonas nauphoetae]|uniref:ATP-dependent (S)-NAD(P)H-hydrate dehydratase n=1 Tax=Blattamonas nauphoetae TaxID=2049346 RepID=A0ABQ9X454_9EUKA|nr:putative ATP-dependent NAD(P)H-hydrate dehydratase [Blattamonas nauphoetae]
MNLATLIPTISSKKGDGGRLAVIGGCIQYTGAPYFSAISALRVGGDIAHVMCTEAACLPIKTYSPELIVHPILPENGKGIPSDQADKIKEWLPRVHVATLGSGLGTDLLVRETVLLTIRNLRELGKPFVIDADGIQLVIDNPSIVRGYQNCILTPNYNEFRKIKAHFYPDVENDEEVLRKFAIFLEGPTILKKGAVDIICDGKYEIRVTEEGSQKRCGGQGDLLTGVTGIFFHWALKAAATSQHEQLRERPSLFAAAAACHIVRKAAKQACLLKGRSLVASDIIPFLGPSVDTSSDIALHATALV